MMEAKKKVCFESFTARVGEDAIVEMRKIIQAEETNIRASYEESTEWIPSEYFVDLILHDSVFIMEIFQRGKLIGFSYHIRVVDQDSVVRNDLILLENQLPYFIFGRLFNDTLMEWESNWTCEKIIMNGFGIATDETTNFKHFTDMFRRVYEESLGDIPVKLERTPWIWPNILELRNADNLSQAGVKGFVLNTVVLK